MNKQLKATSAYMVNRNTVLEGDEFEVGENQANELIKAGLAELVEKGETEASQDVEVSQPTKPETKPLKHKLETK